MIRKHKIYFFFWKLYLRIIGIKEGVFVYNSGNTGIILNLSGDSVSNNSFGFDINIEWGLPTQGKDIRYYTYGAYELKDFKKEGIKVLK